MQQFDHEKAGRVWRRDRFRHLRRGHRPGRHTRDGHGDLADQLRRASNRRIVLNLAEAPASTRRDEKAASTGSPSDRRQNAPRSSKSIRRWAWPRLKLPTKHGESSLRIVSMMVRLVVATESGDRRPASGGYARGNARNPIPSRRCSVCSTRIKSRRARPPVARHQGARRRSADVDVAVLDAMYASCGRASVPPECC